MMDNLYVSPVFENSLTKAVKSKVYQIFFFDFLQYEFNLLIFQESYDSRLCFIATMLFFMNVNKFMFEN